MNPRTLVRHLWMPVAVVALFAFTAIYEQAVFSQLGLTYRQLRVVLPYVVQIGVWLSMAYLVARIIDVTIWDPISLRVPVPKLLRDVTRLIVYSLAITIIFSVVFKKDVTPFWTTTGVSGIVIGLALRNIIVDVFMGLTVNFDRPFQIGDSVSIGGGPSGKVVEINWRTTRILTGDGNLAVIPNGKIGDLTVTNMSRPEPKTQGKFVVALDADVPAERALRVLTAAAMSVAGTEAVMEEPAPKAMIESFTMIGVEYAITYWVDLRLGGPGKAKHAVMKSVLDRLHHAGLHLAVNKQETVTVPPHRDPASVDDRAELLARTDIFATLDLPARQHIAQRMQQRIVAAGENVVGNGEPGDSMFVIFEGLLHAHVPNDNGDAEVRVGALGAGSFFGEHSALTGEPRNATVTAACESLLFEIQKDAFASLIAHRPEMLNIFSEAIAKRRMQMEDALAMSDAAKTAEHESFARHLLGKMMSFFHLGHTTPHGGQTVQAPQYSPTYARR